MMQPLLLALAGLSAGGIHVLARTEAFSIPLLQQVRTDPAVLLFCLAAAVLTG